MSNDLVLRVAGLRQVTCIVRERQLRFYGHVARLPAEDPAHQILSFRDPRDYAEKLEQAKVLDHDKGLAMPRDLPNAS